MWPPLGLILACGSLDGSIVLLTQAGQQWAQTRAPAHSAPVSGLCWGPPIPSSAMFGVLQGQQHADLKPTLCFASCAADGSKVAAIILHRTHTHMHLDALALPTDFCIALGLWPNPVLVGVAC